LTIASRITSGGDFVGGGSLGGSGAGAHRETEAGEHEIHGLIHQFEHRALEHLIRRDWLGDGGAMEVGGLELAAEQEALGLAAEQQHGGVHGLAMGKQIEVGEQLAGGSVGRQGEAAHLAGPLDEPGDAVVVKIGQRGVGAGGGVEGAGLSVIGSCSPRFQELLVDAIDPPSGSLCQADSLEGIGKREVARTGRSREQGVDADAAHKTAGVADYKLLPELPGDMHGGKTGVIAMGKGIEEGFAEGAFAEIRHRHTKQAHIKLLLCQERINPLFYLLHQSQKRRSPEVIDPHLCSLQHLEAAFMAGEAAPDGRFVAQQQQAAAVGRWIPWASAPTRARAPSSSSSLSSSRVGSPLIDLENGVLGELQVFHRDAERWGSEFSDNGGQVFAPITTWMQARDAAVFFDAEVEGSSLGVGQTDGRQGEIPIFQRFLAVSLELHRGGLGRGQRGGEPLGVVDVISSPRSALRCHQSSSIA
jgi:hypothetical protein